MVERYRVCKGAWNSYSGGTEHRGSVSHFNYDGNMKTLWYCNTALQPLLGNFGDDIIPVFNTCYLPMHGQVKL